MCQYSDQSIIIMNESIKYRMRQKTAKSELLTDLLCQSNNGRITFYCSKNLQDYGVFALNIISVKIPVTSYNTRNTATYTHIRRPIHNHILGVETFQSHLGLLTRRTAENGLRVLFQVLMF